MKFKIIELGPFKYILRYKGRMGWWFTVNEDFSGMKVPRTFSRASCAREHAEKITQRGSVEIVEEFEL